MRSPWKGGSMTLRRERCSAPSSSSTERGPTIGRSDSVRPGAGRGRGSEYSARITSGLETITNGVWKPRKRTLNASP